MGFRDCGVVQELGASFNENDDIPAGMEDDVAKWREALLEAAVEIDDAAMEAYLEVQPADCFLCIKTSDTICLDISIRVL